MDVSRKYEAKGPEAEFEAGSRGRVLRNLLGITRGRDMNEAESQALELAQEAALDRYGPVIALPPMISAPCIGFGSARSTPGQDSIAASTSPRAAFQFAHAPLIAGLMVELERGALRRHTPCRAASDADVARALAEVHAELILVHPFREGNGRLARLLALLMALQAGLPPLDFSPLTGRGKRGYIAGIHAAMGRDYAPLSAMFARVIARSRRRAASSR